MKRKPQRNRKKKQRKLTKATQKCGRLFFNACIWVGR